jgi:glycosyltransferase involved in cell wall biosynthesis
MRENITFSVIIPIYNVEAFLKECIDSVLQQTYKDYEIILVDDGSTDESGAIADTYARNYPSINVEIMGGFLLLEIPELKQQKGDTLYL